MIFERKTIRNFYKKILVFYPQGFRERFGESLEQTFNDVCNERKRQAKSISFRFLFLTFGETCVGIVKENLTDIKRGKIMENAISNRKSSSVIGLLLAMPLAILLLIEINNIEPLSSLFKTLTTEADGQGLNLFGKIFTIGTLLLLPLGFIISFTPIARNVRIGKSFAANPINLLTAAALFISIATLISFFVIDQYPCWIGVPNCD